MGAVGEQFLGRGRALGMREVEADADSVAEAVACAQRPRIGIERTAEVGIAERGVGLRLYLLMLVARAGLRLAGAGLVGFAREQEIGRASCRERVCQYV